MFLLLGIFGCQGRIELKEEIGVTLQNLCFAPEALVAKEELPEWLQDKLSGPELSWTSGIYWVQIYKGEWENRTVYMYRTAHLNNWGHFYYENGEGVSLDDLRLTSKNWVLIWKHGENNDCSDLLDL